MTMSAYGRKWLMIMVNGIHWAPIRMRRSSSGNNGMRNVFVRKRVGRIKDFRFLRGRGQLVDDLSRDDLLHAVILRSSVAHGRIRAIDARAALARPGVHSVITAADIRASL